MTTGTLALIIAGAILAQVVVVALIGLYRRVERQRVLDAEASDPRPVAVGNLVSATAAPKPSGPDQTWNAFRELVVVRRVI